MEQQIFIKGKKYTAGQSGLVVLCTETTCNLSSLEFKGVVVEEGRDVSIGHYSEKWSAISNIFKLID